jgi:chemotaxis signal transduction protein
MGEHGEFESHFILSPEIDHIQSIEWPNAIIPIGEYPEEVLGASVIREELIPIIYRFRENCFQEADNSK